MDVLYFNTKKKEALFNELGLPSELPKFYDSGNGWVIHWIGKLPFETETVEDENGMPNIIVKEWQEGEFFNIYLKGQNNMDYFTKSVKSANQILPEPNTPNYTIL